MFNFKDYHIILVPKEKSKTRTFKISGFSLKVLVVSAFLVVPLFLVSVLSAMHYQNKLVVLTRRSLENRELLQSKRELMGKLASLEKNIEHIEDSLTNLGDVLDVDPQSLTTGIGPVVDQDGNSSLTYSNVNTVDINSLMDQWFASNNGTLSVARFDHKIQALQSQTFNLNNKISEMANLNKDRIKYANALPAVLPVKGWVTSEFGLRKHPIRRVTQMHSGLDIAAEHGKSILAPAEGVVIFAGKNSGHGNTVILDHGYGITTLYAHASSITAKMGEKVEVGQEIAKVGSTGASTGPHLHYEVHVDGIPVDPKEYLVE